MRFIIETFQNELKRLNPTMKQIKYGVNDIFNYIDTFSEFNMLCFDRSWGGYAPYGKQDIKNKLLQYLNSINYSSCVCNKQLAFVFILYHHITNFI
ncbi:uncharacterized protein [Blastocystis hominis]|uniref:Uncharacterized protein n=1 Tax=Blastocystis hominis TaxID=12968 RepID=D8M737_BLAHO|nr:uncharacterized protein [Blastocystis hominis]CBK23876.2 unnamed protein product [Blastocystis hominis]|eukprot:XP_012897924.1 uncharacterized protein [Blastocystis hominis]